MKQRNASSFATLRISALLALLWVLPVSPASAIPIRLTGGGIALETPFFGSANLFFEGPGFSLSALQASYDSPGAFPQCGSPPCPVSPIVNLSLGAVFFVQDLGIITGSLDYNGQFYNVFSGAVNVTTPSTVLGPRAGGEGQLVTLPFTLQGAVHGESPTAGSVDLEFIGGGTVRASYTNKCFPVGGCDITNWTLVDLHYDIVPIPEPTSWMLFGSGLLGYAARRRSARRNC